GGGGVGGGGVGVGAGRGVWWGGRGGGEGRVVGGEVRRGRERGGEDGMRKRGRLEQDRMVLITQCVAGRNVLDSNNRGDVARITRFDVFALVGLDLDQTRDAFTFVRARIVNGVAFRQ